MRFLFRFTLPALVLLAIGAPHSFAENNCPLKREIGQLFVVEPPNNDINSREMIEFKRHLLDNNIGGVTLFDWNLPKVNKKKDLSSDAAAGSQVANAIIDYVNALQAGQDPGLFISIDQEGGAVQRLNSSRGFTKLPSLKRQADVRHPSAVRRMAEFSANELQSVGINWNFAPVLDLGTDGESEAISRYKRALSSDAEITGKYGAEIVTGMQENGVMATAKHFPGHGTVAGDSHKESVHLERAWEEITKKELVPFIDAINRDVASIMVGHIIVDDLKSAPGAKSCPECYGLPASVNPFLMQRVLRKYLGFKGLIVTDDISMRAISKQYPIEEATERAILAGADSIIMRKGYEKSVIPYLCRRLQQNTTQAKRLASRIRESHARILDTKRRFDIFSPKRVPYRRTPASTDEAKNLALWVKANSDWMYHDDPEKEDAYGDIPGGPKRKKRSFSRGLKDLFGL